jgi:two-component system, sensor histidine kinase RegB
MNRSLLNPQTGHRHLHRLWWLRNMAIAAQCATLALVHQFLAMPLAWGWMLGVVASLLVLNVFTRWRLRQSAPVRQIELLMQLVADVLALSVLLYFGGGSTNPFVSLYLLPLVIAAATLPRRHTWSMAALTVGCYSVLMVWYVPLPLGHEHHAMAHSSAAMEEMDMAMPAADNADAPVADPPALTPETDAFNTHIFGMWLGFVMSAVVVAYFVVEMARVVRQRDEQLAAAREDTLRNERIVALGTQAASAAHELGTPLSTLAVLIGELRLDAPLAAQDDFRLLDEQVRACKRILHTLLSNAQAHAKTQPVDAWMRDLLDEWQLLRPEVHSAYRSTGTDPAPLLASDASLRAALLNLLNNAADASPNKIDIFAHWDAQQVRLEIHDFGAGLTPEVSARAGVAFFTTKHDGHGLGLFLANATIERMGGTVRLFNREKEGATTEITLPLTLP